ncbi:MAG: lytic murein transglycosylase [Sulfurimonas sp.]|nr:lytic murein transglycosylase [Sulfurimonas sp.]MDD5201690.1 lytic murein transglycosylase [Sulfurimonas sp.]
MKKILLALLLLGSSLMAEFADCNLKNNDYQEICERVVKGGVSYEYANTFLLSYFKTKKFDEESWRLFQPREIQAHSQNEKRANNSLVKYVHLIVAHLREYKEVYDYAEATYGVNREIVASILMKETRLGKIEPKHDAFIVFNTLLTRVTDATPREKWLKNMSKANMVSIISYCYKKELLPEACNLKSSYAGAVGIPQFMPDNFNYAKGYKSEIGDLSDMSDAIVSASYFLSQRAQWSELLDWEKVGNMDVIEEEWYDYDFTHENASFVYAQSKKEDKTYNCYACGREDLNHTREHVQKIMRYNNSSNYAVGVMRLAYDAHQGLAKVAE